MKNIFSNVKGDLFGIRQQDLSLYPWPLPLVYRQVWVRVRVCTAQYFLVSLLLFLGELPLKFQVLLPPLRPLA